MIDFCRKQKLNLLLLVVITLLSCFFISQKQGYHMDELLSFELANADFTPWIVPTQPEGRLEKFLKEILRLLRLVLDLVRNYMKNYFLIKRTKLRLKTKRFILSQEKYLMIQPYLILKRLVKSSIWKEQAM